MNSELLRILSVVVAGQVVEDIAVMASHEA
jgi:hypothetical protein